LREEQAGASAQALARRIERIELELSALSESGTECSGAGAVSEPDGPPSAERMQALEGELAELEQQRELELERELEGLEAAREREAAHVQELEGELAQAQSARARADDLTEQARERLRAAEREVQDTRRESARVGGELAVANQFLRSHARVDGGSRLSGTHPPEDAPKALSEELSVRDGMSWRWPLRSAAA
jgi:chromosome segregation protein